MTSFMDDPQGIFEFSSMLKIVRIFQSTFVTLTFPKSFWSLLDVYGIIRIHKQSSKSFWPRLITRQPIFSCLLSLHVCLKGRIPPPPSSSTPAASVMYISATYSFIISNLDRFLENLLKRYFHNNLWWCNCNLTVSKFNFLQILM